MISCTRCVHNNNNHHDHHHHKRASFMHRKKTAKKKVCSNTYDVHIAVDVDSIGHIKTMPKGWQVRIISMGMDGLDGNKWNQFIGLIRIQQRVQVHQPIAPLATPLHTIPLCNVLAQWYSKQALNCQFAWTCFQCYRRRCFINKRIPTNIRPRPSSCITPRVGIRYLHYLDNILVVGQGNTTA